MLNPNKTFAVFEVDPPALDEFAEDVGFDAEPARGCYKGDVSPAFITSLATFDDFVGPRRYCANQESILLVEHETPHRCWLRYASGGDEYIGQLRKFSERDALKRDGWMHYYGQYLSASDNYFEGRLGFYLPHRLLGA